MPATDRRREIVFTAGPDDDEGDGLRWWEWLIAVAVSCAVAGGVVLAAWLLA
jgi:hypothetical protein